MDAWCVDASIGEGGIDPQRQLFETSSLSSANPEDCCKPVFRVVEQCHGPQLSKRRFYFAHWNMDQVHSIKYKSVLTMGM